MSPVEWNKDSWPVVNDNNPVDLNMNVKTLPQVVYPVKAERTVFTDKKLGPEWIYIQNPDIDNYKLSSGKLCLKATENDLVGSKSPTFVDCRQESINFMSGTSFLFNSKSGAVEAGLTVYQNTDAHYDFFVSKSAGHNVLQARYCIKDMKYVDSSKVVLPCDDKVVIRIKGDTNYYYFEYSIDGGKTFKQLSKANTVLLSSETVGGFTGIVLGMYAVGNPKEVSVDFDYKSLK